MCGYTFSVIDAEGDEKYIDRLTDDYLKRIVQIAQSEQTKITVHLMGEMTFTFSLIKKLQNVGINCVSSTSVRQSKDLGNGQREITFNFVRFRKYI